MPSDKKLAFLERKRKLKGVEESESGPAAAPSDAAPVPKRFKAESDDAAAPKTKKPRQAATSGDDTARKARRRPPPPPKQLAAVDPSSTLFVRNLSYATTSAALEEFFGAHAPVKHAVVVQDKEKKSSLGYGFVSFATAEDAALAKEKAALEKVDGRIVKIDYARHRERAGTKPGAAGTSASSAAESAAGETAAAGGEDTDAEAPAQTQTQTQTYSTEIIVRNLSFKVRRADDLQAHFAKFGAIRDCRVPRGKGQKMLGFGFVMFKRRACAEAAIEAMNGAELDGRPIAVDWSVKLADEAEIKEEPEDADMILEADGVDNELDLDADEVKLEDESDDEGDEDDEEDMDEEDDEEENDDDDDDDEEEEEEDEDDDNVEAHNDYDTTIFVRNLLFETTEEQIAAHFRQFGPTRYCRLVRDAVTERSRGTAFIRFVHGADAQTCLDLYAKLPADKSMLTTDDDRFTLDGRVLDVRAALSRGGASQASERYDAEKRASQGKGVDKRRLFLLEEGQMLDKDGVPDADRAMRKASYNQRKKLLNSNPSLHVSLTRLSVRNAPKHITSADLKYLARQAVVGFGKDVQEGKRDALSAEEKARDAARASGATGVVRQAKMVLDKEDGRSKGYGFVECSSHRYALMCLRWLNGRVVGSDLNLVEMKNAKLPTKQVAETDRKRRLIVEFAIENVAVVKRRQERERASKRPADDKNTSRGATRSDRAPSAMKGGRPGPRRSDGGRDAGRGRPRQGQSAARGGGARRGGKR